MYTSSSNVWKVFNTKLFSYTSYFIHMSITWIYVMSYLWPSVHLAWHKLLHWTLYANRWTIFFHICCCYIHHWLLPFYTTFTDLELAWGSQGLRKARPVDFIFLHTFHLIRMKCNVVMKVFSWTPWDYFGKIHWNKRNNCLFCDCIKKL